MTYRRPQAERETRTCASCTRKLLPGDKGPDCWVCWAKKRDAKKRGPLGPLGARLDHIDNYALDPYWDGSDW